MRVGQGFDAHRLVPGRPLLLGGVEIPCERGLEGHSDGDVLLHAVADALLGASGQGDLGRHFPSSDASLAGADSAGLLIRVRELVVGLGWRVANLDATVVAQEPRLEPHLEAMGKRLAEILALEPGRVNVKATSTDGLGTTGRGEGIAALAVVLLEPAAR